MLINNNSPYFGCMDCKNRKRAFRRQGVPRKIASEYIEEVVSGISKSGLGHRKAAKAIKEAFKDEKFRAKTVAILKNVAEEKIKSDLKAAASFSWLRCGISIFQMTTRKPFIN
jgi:L-fucose isomerase-like protein